MDNNKIKNTIEDNLTSKLFDVMGNHPLKPIDELRTINYVWVNTNKKNNLVPYHYLKNIQNSSTLNKKNASIILYYDDVQMSDDELDKFIAERNKEQLNKNSLRGGIKYENARRVFDDKDELSLNLKKIYQAEINAENARGAIAGNPLKIQIALKASREGKMAVVSDAGVPMIRKLNFDELYKNNKAVQNGKLWVVWGFNPNIKKDDREKLYQSIQDGFISWYSDKVKENIESYVFDDGVLEKLQSLFNSVKTPEDMVRVREENSKYFQELIIAKDIGSADRLFSDRPLSDFYYEITQEKRINNDSRAIMESFSEHNNNHSQSWLRGEVKLPNSEKHNKEYAIRTIQKYIRDKKALLFSKSNEMFGNKKNNYQKKDLNMSSDVNKNSIEEYKTDLENQKKQIVNLIPQKQEKLNEKKKISLSVFDEKKKKKKNKFV